MRWCLAQGICVTSKTPRHLTNIYETLYPWYLSSELCQILPTEHNKSGSIGTPLKGFGQPGAVRQTSPRISIGELILFYEITKERHSVRAASRLSLNVQRSKSDLCELNRLWNGAWIEANFCRLCMHLNQCIVRSYGLLNLYTRRSTTLNCFLKLAFGMNGIPICTATSHHIGPSAP
jgi:hypothetical protein